MFAKPSIESGTQHFHVAVVQGMNKAPILSIFAASDHVPNVRYLDAMSLAAWFPVQHLDAMSLAAWSPRARHGFEARVCILVLGGGAGERRVQDGQWSETETTRC